LDPLPNHLIVAPDNEEISSAKQEGSGQMRPYGRPTSLLERAAIMGVRLRVRHQSVQRAQGAHEIFRYCLKLPLTTAFPSRSFRAFLPEQPTAARGNVSHRSFPYGTNTSLRVVDLVARHQRPSDARHLVRQRHRHQPDRSALKDTSGPTASCAVPLRGAMQGQDSMGDGGMSQCRRREPRKSGTLGSFWGITDQ
jgi:hypothetical protein